MKNLPKYIQKIDNQLWLTEDEGDHLKISYRIKEIIFSNHSSFQHVMILDSYDFGRMLVLDGVVQTTSLDGYIYNEMISHVPLNFHPHPKRVLIIGGGDCGVAKEVTKYSSVEEIHMVEIDKLVVQVCKEHLQEVSGNLSDPRVHFIYKDGVAFVKEHDNFYDVIIIDSSDPIGPAEQLFKFSFYQDLYHALKEDGLMVCQSQSPIFHFNVLKETYDRVGSIFPITRLYTAVVPTYPGGFWSFTLGSKKYDQFISNDFHKDTHYINDATMRRSMDLPEFIKINLNLE